MDSADEQDIETPGGMANGAIGTNGAHEANGTNGQHPTPEGSLSYREEIDSDLDDEVQDEEDFLSQPLQGSSQPLDIGATSTSSLTHLNHLMNMHPQILAKLKGMYTESERQQNRNTNLETLQAAITSGSFHVPLFPAMYGSPPPPLPPMIPQRQQQQQHPQNNHSQPLASSNANAMNVENQLMMASVSVKPPATNSQTGESPQRSCRNNSESSQGSSRNNGESRECESRSAASTNNQHPSGSNWNFEEQFRQVRQLYELDDNPDRKEFLDNLFTFMQQKGTPINRLPIMAKSVLDLYELYKLVVMRGGLVEVINKKLWQEIIKGLRLPASITSAAFTLRTQYMKYLYQYEQHKENLSTDAQLTMAIETNRREGRRSNYPAYPGNNENMVGRNQHNSLPPNTLSLPMPLNISHLEMHRSQSPFVNGHPQQQHHPHNSQHVLSQPNLSNFSEYMLRMLRDRSTGTNSIIQQQSDTSPPTTEALNALELSKLSLWNLYQNNNKIYVGSGQQPSSSPMSNSPGNSSEQREALDLANSTHRSDPVSSPGARSVGSPVIMPGSMKRNQDSLSPPSSNTKRMLVKEENDPERNMRVTQVIRRREDGRRELFISVNIDGILYEGVLPAKHDDDNST